MSRLLWRADSFHLSRLLVVARSELSNAEWSRSIAQAMAAYKQSRRFPEGGCGITPFPSQVGKPSLYITWCFHEIKLITEKKTLLLQFPLLWSHIKWPKNITACIHFNFCRSLWTIHTNALHDNSPMIEDINNNQQPTREV